MERTPASPEKRPFQKERDFHDKRWADKETSRGLLSRKTKDDFMREEAERDDADFERRLHDEYEKWQESLKTVVSNLKESVTRGEIGSESGNMIVFLGGGMKCARSAGQAIGLNMVGVTADKMAMVVGTSGGAVTALKYVEGPEATLRGNAMLTGPLADKKFINPLRPGEVVKLRYIKEVLSQGEYATDVDAVKRSPTELRFTVTLPVKGKENPEVRFLNAKTIKPDMLDGIVSTMSIPYATGPIPEIDGVKYYDGGFTPLPILELIEEFTKTTGYPPKNILICPNIRFDTLENMVPTSTALRFADLLRRHAGSVGSLGKSGSLIQMERGLMIKEAMREGLELVQKQTGVHIGMMWAPDDNLGSLSIDGADMKAAELASARDTIKQFGEDQPDEIPMYVPLKDRLTEAVRAAA